MKKIIALILVFSLCGVLFGCKNGGDEQSTPAQKEQEYRLGFALIPSKAGTDVAFKATFAAVITDMDGKILKCVVDEADASPDMNDFSASIGKEFPTKNALGKNYGMSSASPIGKEWSEQAKAFCDYCAGKTPEQIEQGLGADGKIADLQASCTVYAGTFVECVKQACRNAGSPFTAKGEVLLGISVNCTLSSSSDEAEDDEDGEAVFTCVTATAATDTDGKIYQTYIDEIESRIVFDTEGNSLENPEYTPVSKQMQGSDYGMAGASSLGKEWNTQVNALADYCKGKTQSEIKNSVGEDGKVSDLVSSCTVYSKNYTDAVAAAIENAK
ncbi:MAG: hypothetical protein IKC06_04610 [Clostridia bacterium]|nr:hypothetical protein [Clostridia bacterium]